MRVACIGAGYFAQYHLDAWNRIPEVELSALCDLEAQKAQDLGRRNHVNLTFTSFQDMVDAIDPDVIDIITPPATHLTLLKKLAPQGIDLICQKPFALTPDDAKTMIQIASDNEVRLIVHENFRFQPWYRQIKKMLLEGIIGDLFSISFRLRTGDGWQKDAYLARQPYFRDMSRFLIYETGIHFIDVFRYLGGEIKSVYAHLRRLNTDIKGEDAGIVHFSFKDGASGLWDANRYNMLRGDDPRYTFGYAWVEGSKGSIRLFPDGKMTLQLLGKKEEEINYYPSRHGFAGDCVYTFQKHAIQSILSGLPAETEASTYMNNIQIQEAIYESASQGLPIRIVL